MKAKKPSKSHRKIIIPTAGMANHILSHNYSSTPKALIPVAGKPILAHILDNLKELKIMDLILVVNYINDGIADYVQSNYKFNVEVVEQEKPLGLGHAIYLTRDYIQEPEPVLIILGDTLFEAELKSVINKEYTSIGVRKVDDPKYFGIVNLDSEGFIEEIVEKPDDFIGNLAIIGIYNILNSSSLFESLQHVIGNDIRTKDKYQLTDALNYMLKNNEKMQTFEVDDWFDCGRPAALIKTNRELLQKKGEGKIKKIGDSLFIPPVSLGKNCTIENSIIGPFVTIGDNVNIQRVVIRDSLISSNAQLHNICLTNSIVGDHAKVYGKAQMLNVGDFSEIDFA